MADPAGATGHTRHFLALRPDEAAAARLAALCQPSDGRCVHPADLHLTLAFLGDLRAPSVEALMARLDLVCRPGPLAVVLDRIEAWRGPRALCALGDVPQVADLVDALWRELAAFGHVRDTRPFRPHVTLARKLPAAVCRRPPQALVPPVCWTATELWLLASRPEAGGPGQARYVVQAVRSLL